MNQRKQLPAFQSEAEEANWWYENREKHAEEFVQAFDEGRVKRGSPVRRLAGARGVPLVDLDKEDISKAQALAERRGMEVASFLSLLVHEALERETRDAA